MNSLKTQTVRLMEEKLGRKISYESISPSIFGFLAVKNLRIHSFAEPGTVLLRINRVKIYYNIFDLILTKNPIHSLREVSISNSLFNIDRERDREIFESLKRITAAGNIGQGRTSPDLSFIRGGKLDGGKITCQLLPR